MRDLRWLLAVLVSACCMVIPTVPARAAPRTRDLANCAQSASTLSALFVFDQSGSLANTDPGGIRYDALQIAVDRLSSLTKNGGEQLAVEAAVSGFDHEYHPVRTVARWTRLDAPAFKGDVRGQTRTVKEFMNRARHGTAYDPNGGTDFEVALQGALSDLDDRGGPGSCRVLFWFTDGEFGTARDSVDQARQRMCGSGGLLDKIRQEGIIVVGLQLGDASDDLFSMSEGEGKNQTCGTIPIPSDWAGGIYLRADDPAGLKRIFGTLGDLLQGCTPTGSLKNQIDRGIRRFRVTIETPSRVTALRLDAPDGTAMNVGLSGSTQENGYTATTTTDDDYITSEIVIPSGRPAGKWVVTTDPATTLDAATFCVFHDLRLELADPKKDLKAGVETQVVVHALDRSGAVADLSYYKSVAVGASAIGPDGKIRKAAGSVRGNDIIATLTPLPTDARLELSVTAQLKTTSGLVLTPLANRFKLAVELAKEFPAVRPIDELDLGTAVKKNTTSAPLHLIGSPVGPTQVCFDPPTSISVPKDASGTVPRAMTGCVDLKAGESRDVVVSVRPVQAAEGAGSAILPMTLHSAASGKQKSQHASVPLPVVWRFSDPLNAPVLIGVIVLVAAIAVLLPLLALGFANLLSAKFETRDLQVGTIRLLVSSADIRRKDALSESGRIVDVFKDLTPLAVTTPRRFQVADGVELRATGTLNPFGAPSFRAIAPPGHRIISSVGLPIAGDREAAVSPALGFVALGLVAEADLEATGPEVPTTLVVLQRDFEVDAQTLDRLVKQMPWAKIATQWRDGWEVGARSVSPDNPQTGPTSGDSPYLKFD